VVRLPLDARVSDARWGCAVIASKLSCGRDLRELSDAILGDPLSCGRDLRELSDAILGDPLACVVELELCCYPDDAPPSDCDVDAVLPPPAPVPSPTLESRAAIVALLRELHAPVLADAAEQGYLDETSPTKDLWLRAGRVELRGAVGRSSTIETAHLVLCAHAAGHASAVHAAIAAWTVRDCEACARRALFGSSTRCETCAPAEACS
jgi:hypothetical protein